ncbi:MAG: hypothetical protein ACE5HT_06425 [Gemmatimonadales bacterium]
MRCQCSSLLLVAVLAGCAAGGASTTTPRSSSRTVITAAELAQATESNLYDVVRRLRPTWLQRRGGRGLPPLFIDNVRAGDVDRMQSIMIETVLEVRFIPPRDATTRWGTGYPAGVIEVIQRRG